MTDTVELLLQSLLAQRSWQHARMKIVAWRPTVETRHKSDVLCERKKKKKEKKDVTLKKKKKQPKKP